MSPRHPSVVDIGLRALTWENSRCRGDMSGRVTPTSDFHARKRMSPHPAITLRRTFLKGAPP